MSLFDLRRNAANLVLVVAVALILGFLKPFGMSDLPDALVYSYWLTVCVAGYFVYAPMLHVIDWLLQPRVASHWQRIALGTALASVIMAALVPTLTGIFFNVLHSWSAMFLNALPKTIVIGGVITVITFARDTLHKQNQALSETNQALEQNEDASLNQILNELPLEKRGQLLALETQDHYLNVHTDKGQHLILMRLKDALALLQNHSGLQVHRSWWVAESAIKGNRKVGRKPVLTLLNGLEAPVSRTYLEQVKAKGWLN